jgi:hypothetical protein
MIARNMIVAVWPSFDALFLLAWIALAPRRI